MVDWQGLLKFSLQYSDGTHKSNFHQLSPQNKKWLEQALDHYSNSQFKRIQKILEELSLSEEPQQQQYRLQLLEELQQLMDSLDRGRALYKMNGHIILLKIIFYSKFDQCRIVALQIISSANQNDSLIQTQSINIGALELVQKILKQQKIKVIEAMMSTISSIVRGQNLQAKRIFIRIKGLQVLKILLQKKSQRLTDKICVLLIDLIYYDDRLHYHFNDLSSFSNTNNIKLNQQDLIKKDKQGLKYDFNQEYKNKNELEQHKQFRGYIKRYLQSQQGKILKQIYNQYLKRQLILEKQL